MSNVSETAPQTMHTALGLLDVSALAGLDTYCGVVFVFTENMTAHRQVSKSIKEGRDAKPE